MNINLNLTVNSLILCNSILQDLYNGTIPHNERGKVVKTIALDVADKIDKKCRNAVKKASLFDEGKKHKLTLKYYEAWGLHESLIVLNALNGNVNSRHIIQNIIATLNQKLA